MRFASLTLAMLLAPSIGLAQNSGGQFPAPDAAKVNLSPAMAARLSTLTGSCPVGLRAQRRGVTTYVTVDGKLRRQEGPTVRLMVNNLQGKDIVGATVRVRGYGARPQLFPVSGASSTGEIAKTMTLKLNVGQGKNGETEVTAEKFAAVSRIDLELIEYADGTVWRASSEQPCSVEPDLLMLVADK